MFRATIYIYISVYNSALVVIQFDVIYLDKEKQCLFVFYLCMVLINDGRLLKPVL